MKTLVALRHSLKNSENSITSKGLVLAEIQGKCLQYFRFSRIFTGPTLRTVQTRDALLRGYNLPVEIVEKPIEQIGNEELFWQISTEKFKAMAKATPNLYEALVMSHNIEQIEEWAEVAFQGIFLMFSLMSFRYSEIHMTSFEVDRGETATYIGNSPMIELAAAFVHGGDIRGLPDWLRHLPEMAGIIFQMDREGCISIKGGISQPMRHPRRGCGL